MERNRDSTCTRLHYPAFRAIWLSSAVCLPTDRAVIVLVFPFCFYIPFFSCQKWLFFPVTLLRLQPGRLQSPMLGRGLRGPELTQARAWKGWKGAPTGAGSTHGSQGHPKTFPAAQTQLPHPRAAASSGCPRSGVEGQALAPQACDPSGRLKPPLSSPDPPRQAPGSSLQRPPVPVPVPPCSTCGLARPPCRPPRLPW